MLNGTEFISISFELPILSLYVRDLKGEFTDHKAKLHKSSLIVGVQNGMPVLGLCHFVSKEFGDKASGINIDNFILV